MSRDELDIDFTEFGGVRVVQGDEEAWYFGWAQAMAPEERPHVIPRIEKAQGHPVKWEDVYKASKADDDKDVFLWHNEEKVLGKAVPAWNQGGVGSCVSFGWGRGANDLLIKQAAQGIIEFPEAEVATEPIYGGSRVEVGRGVLGNGDGSLGSWAAEWMLKWGILLRKKYGSHDLSKYNEAKCREYGRKGCPDDLEPEARLYPIKSVAMITKGDDAWTGLGLEKPIPICSNRGFDTPLKNGFCEPNKIWNHCMEVCGRFISTDRNNKRCVVIRNSWADYLRSVNNPHSIINTRNGPVQMPTGCFATTLEVLDGILRQKDSYIIDEAGGFKERNRFKW